MSQMTLKIKKVGMKNPKTKVLGFAGPRGSPTDGSKMALTIDCTDLTDY